MRIINNVPCSYQDIFDEDMVFVLLHKLIGNDDYKNFYLDSTNKFNFIILDNSAFELGEGLNKKILKEWAVKLRKAHSNAYIEIVIPDSYGNKGKTIELMYDFLNGQTDFNLMAIPQGKTQDELIECLNLMLTIPRISCIGINKLWNNDTINIVAKKIIEAGKSIHRLGVTNLSDWSPSKYRDLVRSTDSRILSKIVTGDEDPWESTLNEQQIEILKRLINEVKKW